MSFCYTDFNMYEEARANLLALADELEELGEDGQAEICRDAANRLPVECGIPLPFHAIFRKSSLHNTPLSCNPMDGGGGIR